MPVQPGVLGGDSFATYSVPYARGNLTAIGLRGSEVLATHVVKTSGSAASIQLTVDCPSPITGTGQALVLDGQDTGLIRATIVDADGTVVHNAAHNVTFKVISGHGEIVGVHSGQPDSHEPTHGTTHHTAYHGLVRAVVRVTTTNPEALGDLEEATLRQYIDVDHSISVNSDVGGFPQPIVLEASAPGLGSARVSVATSVDPGDTVLEVASKLGSAPVFFD